MAVDGPVAGNAGVAAGEAAEQLAPRTMTFRGSGKRVALRSVILFGAALLAAGLGGLPLGFSPQGGLVLLGAFVLAVLHYLVAWWIQVGSYGIRVDAGGVHRLDPRGAVTIAWSDLQSIDLAETPVQVRGRPLRLRYIVLESRGPERILFSDLSPVGSPTVRIDLDGPRPITDVDDSGVLLAVLADRIGDERYLPDVLMERERVEAPAGTDAAGAARDATAPPDKRRISVGGFLALLAKLGTKLAKGIPVALKTFKPGLAIASVAVYGILLTWQFAVAIMVMLAFHEYGHVHAMRKAGLRVRGIYFLPLLGAAAVTEDTWRSRSEQAAIGLAGPIWGLGLTAVAALADLATGYAHPFLGVVVAWWALLNLFNLLPVNPLDGGRVLSAIGYSLSSRLGALLSAAAFVAALLVAWVFQVTLLAIVGAIGLVEFAGEASGALRFRRLLSSPRVAALSPAGLATLKGLARPSLGEEADQAYFHLELRQATRLRQMARVRPMTRGEMVRWTVTFVVVAGALLALLVVSSTTHPDAMLAREILR